MVSKHYWSAAFLLVGALLGINSAAMASPIKIAFIGDQGNNSNARAVLTLIANEETDLLLIQGDLGYTANAAAEWDANLTSALGSDFPVLTVVGNHENFEWPLYQRLIQQRINRSENLDCLGNTGVKALCQFGNIDIVQIAQGISEVAGINPNDDYEEYIRTSFASSSHRWRICSWHKNQKDMQPAGKNNSTGWGIYDACLDAGAMIAMGHAHAYSRTHLLSNFEKKTVVNKSSDMTLQPGQSFAFVSGLGGRDVVPQQHGGDWFASIYTASQGATHGALFCTIDISTADCYFKAIDGAIPDRFTLTLNRTQHQNVSLLAPPPPASQSISAPATSYVFSRTDVTEYRWIDLDASGTPASIWIDQACAEQLGGPKVKGDWETLSNVAPSLNAIDSPCPVQTGVVLNDVTASSSETDRDAGYVFSRTDLPEYRWINRDQDGRWASIWIDQTCAQMLGGPTASGDWDTLSTIAPAFDAIESPCVALAAATEPTLMSSTPGRFNDVGYVYSRSDKVEFRWIARDDKGMWGSIWINEACAKRLGGPKASGDWFALMKEAPGFDSIPNPCS